MQLNLFTDYALRVLVYSAVHQDRLCTVDEVSTAFGISRHHLVKIVNQLQHLGYVDTRRGRSGGFQLSCAPETIRLGDIVRRTEGSLALVECFNSKTNTCPLAKACGVKGALREAFDAFFTVLDRYTLSDLVAEPRWVDHIVTLLPHQKERAHA